jgi:hypothetical protein
LIVFIAGEYSSITGGATIPGPPEGSLMLAHAKIISDADNIAMRFL